MSTDPLLGMEPLGYAATMFLAHAGSHWFPFAGIEIAICVAAISAAIVLIEGWCRDPDGPEKAASRAALASCTSLLGALVPPV